MSAIDPGLADRLAKICSRLASDFDGERSAAALLASRAIKDAGLTWQEVLEAASSSKVSVAQPPRRGFADHEPTHFGLVVWAQRYTHVLNAWEIEFLASVKHRYRLSWKQRDALERIVDTLRKRGCR